jgi:hypothetical protein
MSPTMVHSQATVFLAENPQIERTSPNTETWWDARLSFGLGPVNHQHYPDLT